MTETRSRVEPKSQVDKFREAAREIEADDSEVAFDARLKKIAKAIDPDTKGAKNGAI